MKAFWLNGGLMIQPENSVEREALTYLLRIFHLELPPECDRPSPPNPSLNGQVEKGSDIQL